MDVHVGIYSSIKYILFKIEQKKINEFISRKLFFFIKNKGSFTKQMNFLHTSQYELCCDWDIYLN